MRSDLPAAVRAALECATRPALVFDLTRIEANVRAIAAAARDITVLFAMKSFPHPAVREICGRWFAGFDVASPGELAEVGGAKVVSIADPSGRARAPSGPAPAPAARSIVGCETVEQVAAAPAHAEIAIRISASITGRDPGIGAVLDGSGHRRSRFGLDDRAEIAAIARAAAGRPIGLHVHHGPVAATTSERFLATARAVLALAHEAGVEPRFLDVGGAWHAVADLPRALAELRAAIPAAIELVIEPGRVIADGAGFACGRVVVARMVGDRPLRVVDLSRICHLRWSHVELVSTAPHPGTGVATSFVGPTCFEEDALGDWIIAPARFTTGARVIVRHVTGYALAWNVGFGGVAPADVVVVP